MHVNFTFADALNEGRYIFSIKEVYVNTGYEDFFHNCLLNKQSIKQFFDIRRNNPELISKKEPSTYLNFEIDLKRQVDNSYVISIFRETNLLKSLVLPRTIENGFGLNLNGLVIKAEQINTEKAGGYSCLLKLWKPSVDKSKSGNSPAISLKGVVENSAGYGFAIAHFTKHKDKLERQILWELKAVEPDRPNLFIENTVNKSMVRGADSWELHDLDMKFIKISNTSSEFHMAETEVTQKQYWKVTGRYPSKFSFNGDKRPVENISFVDAENFCDILNKWSTANNILPNNYEFRLPYTSEYLELGLECKFISSKEFLNYSRIRENSFGVPCSVKTKRPSEYGLYDIWGNIAEMSYLKRNGRIYKTMNLFLGDYQTSQDTMRLFWGADINDDVLTSSEKKALKKNSITSILPEPEAKRPSSLGFRVCIAKKVKK